MTRNEKLESIENFIAFTKQYKNSFPANKLIAFNNAVSSFNSLKQKVYNKRLEAARTIISLNKKALQLSVFELMEYNYKENSHSNVLRYLLDYHLSGNIAVVFLCEIMKLLSYDSYEFIIDKIRRKQYQVIREKPLPNGRIDLFIVDEENEFVIVIENKILAEIVERTDIILIEEQKNSVTRTQLDNYRDYVESNYKNYNKFFILLHFKSFSVAHEPYKKINYEQIEYILNSIDVAEDNIIIDYKILLNSLNKNIYPKKKIELLQKITALKLHENVKLSLTEIEQIKLLYYG